MEKKVILVNERDEETGTAGKMEAHEKGLLHRAFSIFVFNKDGEMLLQRRALHKYHSGGLWTNACCSHPQPGEPTEAAARRRLGEELGFETGVTKIFDFVYKAKFENGLTEYEFDHVFAGEYSGEVRFDKEEVMETRYLPMQEIKESLEKEPGKFTAWFKDAFPGIENWWRRHYQQKVV